MRQRRVLALATSVALGATVALGGATTSAGAAPAPPAPTKAPVTANAAGGGHVIITLKQQYTQYKVRAHSAQRTDATRSSQKSVVSQIKSSGGTGVTQLVSVNAVAAKVSKAEVAALRKNPAVKSVTADMKIAAAPQAAAPGGQLNQQICPSNPAKPLLEPEALTLLHDRSQPSSSTDAANIATGKGVIVGLTGINGLAGNPNFIRPNGQHVVIDSPTPNEDDANSGGGGDEWYGDASSISGQGTVTYDFAKELPYSGLPAGCTFKIFGTAPDASLVDTGYFGQGGDAQPQTESQAIAGLDNASIEGGASVISESYGYGAIPGFTDYAPINEANDQLVAAGITVVESAGDSGVGGTVEVPASDPLVIDAGATTAYRLDAQAWGYPSWENNNLASLSSGGTTPTNNVVDLVATGDGGEATCSPASGSCPSGTLTEAFGGTSESAPFVAGAAADVIQAYRDSHAGTSPTPALVKQILTGTATDLDSESDNQGSGLLNIYAAVRAAQQEPGGTVSSGSSALVPTATQLNVLGKGGSASAQSETLYNTSSKAAKVSSTYRTFSAPTQIGKTVTEKVTAPPASAPVPAEGAAATKATTMKVPAGLSQLGVDFITPNPDNDAVLALLLFDPKGKLAQISYDYSETATGPVSNTQHVSVNDPMAGKWTARVVWNNGRSHLQDPPPVPGSYRGTVSVRFTGETASTSKAAAPVTIAAHSSATVPLTVSLPKTAGDHPQSVQFTSNQGSTLSVPITRRTLISGPGVTFSTSLGSSVARGLGPLKSFEINVPAGLKDIKVNFATADTSADNIIDYFLVAPNGDDGYYDRTPSTTPQGVGSQKPSGKGAIVVADPPAGLWTVQTMLDLTASGKEFDQTVTGTVSYDTAKVHAYNIPDSASSKLAAGSSTTLQVAVTNTTGVGRTFDLTSSNGDVTGAAVYIPAGATVLVTGTLKPTAAAGTVVSGQVVVESNGSDLSDALVEQQDTFDTQTLASLPYEYTVSAPSS